jgi:hypothetical protein
MTFKSAYDDLRQRTVEKIPGTLRRLNYVAGLRSLAGDYAHWGLERVHGAAAAQDAFVQMHRALIKTILRTRLGTLQEDLGQSSQAEGLSSTSYASRLSEGLSRLLPSNCPKETELHLLSVLETLATLEARKKADSQSS